MKRVELVWPELPADLSDRASLEKWYYDLRTNLERVRTEVEDLKNNLNK